jgi:myo-inositol-hexaphosphate 3-phosphohydrolase
MASMMFKLKTMIVVFATALLLAAGAFDIPSVVRTEQISHDLGDPSIWVHPYNPARSLIIATNRMPGPNGSHVAFGIDGRIRRRVRGVDRPDSIDMEYGLSLGGHSVDIAVSTEEIKQHLRVFRVSDDDVVDITSPKNTIVLADRENDKLPPWACRATNDGKIMPYSLSWHLRRPNRRLSRAVPPRRRRFRQGEGDVCSLLRCVQRHRGHSSRSRTR